MVQYIGNYSEELGTFSVTNVPYYYDNATIAITIAEILNYLASLNKDNYRWKVVQVTHTEKKVNLYQPQV